MVCLETHPQVCWERSVETLTARKDEIAGLAVASDERIEAFILYLKDGRDSVAALFRRGRWSPSDATALSTPRGACDLPVPEGPLVGNLEGIPGVARFPPRRRASTLRGEGAVQLVLQCKTLLPVSGGLPLCHAKYSSAHRFHCCNSTARLPGSNSRTIAATFSGAKSSA